jgi:hypothetical protein
LRCSGKWLAAIGVILAVFVLVLGAMLTRAEGI